MLPVIDLGIQPSRGQHNNVSERIRRVIRDHAHLPVDVAALDDDADLFQAGMTSHASVNVMLGLEAEFDVEFPDAMLKRSVFQSVAAISAALGQLRPAA
jgi:acyl carrier protein